MSKEKEMSYKEAINILDEDILPESNEMDKALDVAIKALESMPEYEKLKERDTAKKLVNVNGHRKCPNCGTDKNISHLTGYCSICGQKIDWS